jgi:hypothetical protein
MAESGPGSFSKTIATVSLPWLQEPSCNHVAFLELFSVFPDAHPQARDDAGSDFHPNDHSRDRKQAETN